jgi:hypothetical protein
LTILPLWEIDFIELLIFKADESKVAYEDLSKWKEVISAYPYGKRASYYVCENIHTIHQDDSTPEEESFKISFVSYKLSLAVTSNWCPKLLPLIILWRRRPENVVVLFPRVALLPNLMMRPSEKNGEELKSHSC